MELRPILSALLRSKTGAILVALQVAISLAILVNALHIVHLRQAVAARPSGLADEASLAYLQVRHLHSSDHNAQMAQQKAETATLRAVGGVTSVAFASQMPMSRSGSNSGVSADRKQVNESAASSSYFSADSLVATWGLKLVEGRDFRPDEVIEIDNNAAADDVFPPVVIITRALGQKVWPGAASFVGKTLYFGTGAKANGAQVVGVIEHLQTQNAEVSEKGDYSTILPMRLSHGFSTLYTLRAESGQRERVLGEAQAALRRAATGPLIVQVGTVDGDRQQRYRADNALPACAT